MITQESSLLGISSTTTIPSQARRAVASSMGADATAEPDVPPATAEEIGADATAMTTHWR